MKIAENLTELTELTELLELFLNFLQIGIFAFGGGYAMIPLITEKLISMELATHEQLLEWIVVGESLPGAFAVNVANFAGASRYGIVGAAVAVFGLVLPGFIIILIIAGVLTRFIEYKGVAAALRGLTPAATSLILTAAVSIALTAFNSEGSDGSGGGGFNIPAIIIFAVVLGLYFIKKLKMNAYKIIIISAALGIIHGIIFL